MKTTLTILLTLILGIGLISSCSKTEYVEPEQFTVDIHKHGKAEIKIEYLTTEGHTHVHTDTIEVGTKILVNRSITKSITAKSLEDGSRVRIDASIWVLDNGDSYKVNFN